jgi:hypothetical protein
MHASQFTHFCGNFATKQESRLCRAKHSRGHRSRVCSGEGAGRREIGFVSQKDLWRHVIELGFGTAEVRLRSGSESLFALPPHAMVSESQAVDFSLSTV